MYPSIDTWTLEKLEATKATLSTVGWWVAIVWSVLALALPLWWSGFGERINGRIELLKERSAAEEKAKLRGDVDAIASNMPRHLTADQIQTIQESLRGFDGNRVTVVISMTHKDNEAGAYASQIRQTLRGAGIDADTGMSISPDPAFDAIAGPQGCIYIRDEYVRPLADRVLKAFHDAGLTNVRVYFEAQCPVPIQFHIPPRVLSKATSNATSDDA